MPNCRKVLYSPIKFGQNYNPVECNISKDQLYNGFIVSTPYKPLNMDYKNINIKHSEIHISVLFKARKYNFKMYSDCTYSDIHDFLFILNNNVYK